MKPTEIIHANIIAPPHSIPTTLSENSRKFFSISQLTQRSSNCIVCGQQTGRVIQTDIYGNVCCGKHRLSTCLFCGHLITEERVILQGIDGYVCKSCATPNNMDHLFPSAMKLRNFYRNKHIYVPEHSLCLMTAGQMYEKYYASYHTIPLGMARLENNQYTIEIMCQQSELGMLKTLAHEMLHLFMYNRNLWPEKSICEGFCNLGSYLALCELESENPETLHLLAQLMENRDRSYGEGFRRLKLIYDLKGMDGCIAVLREFYGRHRE